MINPLIFLVILKLTLGYKCEYVIVVLFSKNYGIEAIYELDWDNFLEIKKWYSRMRAWNLPINKDFQRSAKLIYPQI
ncbi:TPA: hypothetical protein ACGW3F_002556 [Bacillus paranthracis]